ncbi:AbrB/MazE/SpoVT family DNA-binding domain-containing protein [Variovorax rhizosphaerae]|uniref:AbrB/MazE/SpoVT family DNA-binding domain-containing protein n=1 Tax=Variovorax rhizosphaerae TaxID=1836200 RepID=A0ABU8WG48_9BURK
MTYARVFRSGNSQAVRLPRGFQFTADRVEIFHQGNDVVLRERPVNAAAIFDALVKIPVDSMAEARTDGLPQERESI